MSPDDEREEGMDRTYESNIPYESSLPPTSKHHDHHARCRSSRGLPIGSISCTCDILFMRDDKEKLYALLKAKYTGIEIFAQLYGSDELKAFLNDLEQWKMEDAAVYVKDEESSECDCEDCNLPDLGEKEE